MKQLTLFGDEAVRPAPKKKSGGSEAKETTKI